MRLEIINPDHFQRFPAHVTESIHEVIAHRRLNSAKERIPPKPTAPPGFVPLHGISRSIPMSAPRAVARRKLQNND